MHFHRYITVKDCYSHEYLQCTKCEKRRIEIKVHSGYFPIDGDWVKTGKFRPEPKIPPIGLGAGSR